jgi:hypothetical protein
MLNLSSVIIRLKQVADFAPQYECGVLVEDEEFRNLLESYPQLAKFPTYLEFLRITGGAHISNKTFSLGIYGFSGMVVPSFLRSKKLSWSNRSTSSSSVRFCIMNPTRSVTLSLICEARKTVCTRSARMTQGTS